MARIIWSDSATADLRSIGEFYERRSPAYASSIVTTLYNSVSRLQYYPRSGRRAPELDEESLREILVEGFRVIYELTGDQIRVVAVLHSRQDLPTKFAGDD
jgi:toxin ParE1/3/4